MEITARTVRGRDHTSAACDRRGVGGDAQPIERPAYSVTKVVVDPGRGFGQPIFRRGGAQLEDVVRIAPPLGGRRHEQTKRPPGHRR